MKVRKQTETDIISENSDTTGGEELTHPLEQPKSKSHKNPQAVSKIISSYQTLIASNNAKINELTIDLELTRQKLSVTETRYATLINVIGSDSQTNLQTILDKIDELQKLVYEQKLQIRKLKAEKLHARQLSPREGLMQRKDLSNFFNMESLRQNNEILIRKRKNSLIEQQNSYSWKKMLQNFSQLNEDCSKFKEKTITMVKKFIPHEERSKIWPLIFQDKLGITDTLYIELLERRKQGLLQPYVEHQIEKDIERSFDKRMKTNEKGVISSQIKEILEIFHLLRPDVSYVQGMTYPVIILVSVVGKFQAFRIFSNLVISNQFFRRMYSFQDNYIDIYCRVFEDLLKQFQPTVFAHLSNLNIKSEIFLIEWFFTLFSRGLSIETTLKIWDMIGYQQEIVLYRIGLAVFEIIGKRLTQEDYQKTIGLIRSFWSYVDQNKLLEVSIKNYLLIPQSKLDKMIKKHARNSTMAYLRQ